VVSSIYATFLQRAFDNLFHDVCLQENPVVFAIDRAGISGPDGSTHHGIYDISFLNAMPNMVITQPRDGHILRELLESAFQWGCTAAIRYPNMATDNPDLPLRYHPVGRGEVLAEGKDLLIISLGHMNQTAFKVRESLLSLGTSATILDPIFVKPLDADLLNKLLLTHSKVVTLEEHSVVSGLGSIVNNFLMQNGFNNVQVLNCGIPEIFLDQGSHAELIASIGLTADQITARIKDHFNLTNTSDCFTETIDNRSK
jgi:1-deoxy-D-xylulose-5-phosphate synthase